MTDAPPTRGGAAAGPSRRLSMRTHLLLLVAGVLLPGALTFVAYLVAETEEATEAAYERVHDMAGGIATQIHDILTERQRALARIAALPLVRALDPRACTPFVGQYAAVLQEATEIGLRDAEGRLVCASVADVPPASEAREFPWFREGIASGRASISGAFQGRNRHRWYAVLTHPVHDASDRVVGLVVFRVDLRALNERVLGNPPPGATIAVLDRDLRFLLRSSDAGRWIGQPLPAPLAEVYRGRSEGFERAPNVAGLPHLWAFVTVPGTGWRVSVGLPEDAVFADRKALVARSAAIGAALVAVLVLLALGLSVRFARPMRELAAVSARIAAGETSLRAAVRGPAEIAEVAARFNFMLDWLERQREERIALASHLATLIDKARDIVLLMNADGAIVSANEAAVAAYGRPADELCALNIRDLRAPATQAALRRDWQASANTEGILFETEHLRRDGTVFPVEVSSRAIDIEGKLYRQSFIRDITERHSAQAALARSERARRTLIDCNQALARADDEAALLADLCRLFVDRGGYRMVWIGSAEDGPGRRVRPVCWAGHEDGYLEEVVVCWSEEACGQGPTGTALRERRPVVAQDLAGDQSFAPWRESALRRGYASLIALPLELAGGAARAVIVIYAAEPDAFDAAETELLVELAEDIAFGVRALHERLARERAERELEIRSAQLAHLLEASSTVIYALQRQGGEFVPVDVSPNVLRVTGYRVDEALAAGWWQEHLHPDDRQAAIDARADDGDADEFQHDYRFRDRAGRQRWIHDSMRIVRDARGNAVEVVGSWTDITAIKDAEATAQQEAARLAESQRIAHVGSWELDLAAMTIRWSDEAYRIYGVEPGAFAPGFENFLDLLHPEDRGRMRAWLADLLAGRAPDELEFRTVHADGTTHWVSGRGKIVCDGAGRPVSAVGTAQDITRRKRVDEELAQQLRELQRWRAVTLGREGRVIELKREVDELLARLGEPPRFASSTGPDDAGNG